MLLRARDEDTGESMTDRQLRDEVMPFPLAGHESLAGAGSEGADATPRCERRRVPPEPAGG
jgi:cytochrome P450